jgi:glycosyltransferase involved in cell wall biosynthesis
MRSGTDPLVSAVVPAHERIEELCEAVQSAINQDYGNLEIVIADDQSDPLITQDMLPDPKGREIRILRTESSSGPGGCRELARSAANLKNS